MNKKLLPLLAYIGLTLPALTMAEQPSAEMRTLNKPAHHADVSQNPITLHEAINRTIKHNPKLRVFEYQRKAQQGRALQAGFSPSPELRLSVEDAAGSGAYSGVDNAQATLGISWVIEGALRQRYVDLASAGTSALVNEANINLLDVSAETARLYILGLAHQAHRVNAVSALKLARQMADVIRKRVSAGKTTEAELARAQVDVMRRELELEDTEHELSSAYRLLAAQWGEKNINFSHVGGDLFSLPAIVSFAALQARLEQSPGFTRLLSEKRLKQAELKLAEAKSSPGWNINLGVRHFKATDDQALVAGISIPFGARSRNTGGIAEAHANLSQVEVKADELRVRYDATLYGLYQELQHSQHQVETYRKKIIPQLERALKQTRRAYNLGRYGYLELSSVQNDLLTARSVLVEASIATHLENIEIERLTGVRVAQSAGE